MVTLHLVDKHSSFFLFHSAFHSFDLSCPKFVKPVVRNVKSFHTNISKKIANHSQSNNPWVYRLRKCPMFLIKAIYNCKRDPLLWNNKDIF